MRPSAKSWNQPGPTPDGCPDKHYLYGRYYSSVDRQNRLNDQIVRKALDMETEPEDIDARRYGMGWKELVAILAALVAVVLYLNRHNTPDPAPAPAPQAPAHWHPENVESQHEYEIRFYDQGGQPVRIDPYRQPIPGHMIDNASETATAPGSVGAHHPTPDAWPATPPGWPRNTPGGPQAAPTPTGPTAPARRFLSAQPLPTP